MRSTVPGLGPFFPLPRLSQGWCILTLQAAASVPNSEGSSLTMKFHTHFHAQGEPTVTILPTHTFTGTTKRICLASVWAQNPLQWPTPGPQWNLSLRGWIQWFLENQLSPMPYHGVTACSVIACRAPQAQGAGCPVYSLEVFPEPAACQCSTLVGWVWVHMIE